MLTREFLVGEDIERCEHELRQLLPVDEHEQLNDCCVVALRDGGRLVAAVAYYYVGSMSIFGAIIGISPSFMRKATEHELKQLLLLHSKEDYGLIVTTHEGHPGADKALMRIGFEPLGNHRFILRTVKELRLDRLLTRRSEQRDEHH